MMKPALLAALTILAVFATGCDDTSPTNAVKSAAVSLHRGKFKQFRFLLSGKAKEVYGDRSAFDDLRSELSDRNLEIQEPKFESSTSTDSGSLETYTVRITDKDSGANAVTTIVVCDVGQTSCLYGATVIPNCTVTETMHCSLSDIQL